MWPTPWEFWTELIVPGVSALGTAAVATIAIVISARATAADRAAREREAQQLADERARRLRADFLPVADAYLRSLSASPVEEAPGDEILMIYDKSSAIPRGQYVASWVRRASGEIKLELLADARSPGDIATLLFGVRAVIMARLRQWVETGELDESDLNGRAGEE